MQLGIPLYFDSATKELVFLTLRNSLLADNHTDILDVCHKYLNQLVISDVKLINPRFAKLEKLYNYIFSSVVVQRVSTLFRSEIYVPKEVQCLSGFNNKEDMHDQRLSMYGLREAPNDDEAMVILGSHIAAPTEKNPFRYQCLPWTTEEGEVYVGITRTGTINLLKWEDIHAGKYNLLNVYEYKGNLYGNTTQYVQGHFKWESLDNLNIYRDYVLQNKPLPHSHAIRYTIGEISGVNMLALRSYASNDPTLFIPNEIAYINEITAPYLATVVLPTELKIITNKAFKAQAQLNTVVLPRGSYSIHIGESAFKQCCYLKRFPGFNASEDDGVSYTQLTIAGGAFYQAGLKVFAPRMPLCYKLDEYNQKVPVARCTKEEMRARGEVLKTSLGAPERLHIGYNAFSYCDNLERVDFTHIKLKSFSAIEAGVFTKCSQLQSVDLGDILTVIPARMFSDCYKLHTVEGTKVVETLSEGAFARTCIRRAIFPSILKIHQHVFEGVEYIEELQLTSEVGVTIQNLWGTQEALVGIKHIKRLVMRICATNMQHLILPTYIPHIDEAVFNVQIHANWGELLVSFSQISQYNRFYKNISELQTVIGTCVINVESSKDIRQISLGSNVCNVVDIMRIENLMLRVAAPRCEEIRIKQRLSKQPLTRFVIQSTGGAKILVADKAMDYMPEHFKAYDIFGQ